ncbi:hypothetical protein PENSPDRAFT_751928 [Peniophora sp. CONT]|nr:hypothetical protein PENSPDRAFT_751928 [Peniophora sp. CONT]
MSSLLNSLLSWLRIDDDQHDDIHDDTLIHYHLIWRALLHGSSDRPALPTELVALIVRYSEFAVPDPARTLSAPGKVSVTASTGDIQTKRWFATPPLTDFDTAHIAAFQLVTYSKDQGWAGDPNTASYSWFDIGIGQPNAPLAELRWTRSHHNKLRSSKMCHHEGAIIRAVDAGWEVGDVISVWACAQFGAWSCEAASGELRFWKWFEPVILL